MSGGNRDERPANVSSLAAHICNSLMFVNALHKTIFCCSFFLSFNPRWSHHEVRLFILAEVVNMEHIETPLFWSNPMCGYIYLVSIKDHERIDARTSANKLR